MSGSQQPRSMGCDRRPIWSGLEAVAPTLAYDHTYILGPDASVPVERAARISASTLVMYGGAGLPFMAQTAHTLRHAIAGAQLRILEGQTHQVDSAVLAPVLIDFLPNLELTPRGQSQPKLQATRRLRRAWLSARAQRAPGARKRRSRPCTTRRLLQRGPRSRSASTTPGG